MRVMITGIGGFVGSHLVRYLLTHQPNVEIWGCGRGDPPAHMPMAKSRYFDIDLRQPQNVLQLLRDIQPSLIFHLAAQAFVPQSWLAPWETLETNIRMQLNLLEAIGALGLQSQTRMLSISSNEVYGRSRPNGGVVTEADAYDPQNPYAISKVSQEQLALLFARQGQHGVVARPFNHIGPGQLPPFMAPSFARQIARIEAGLQPPVMNVGNLAAERDFSDVRDVVQAYWLLIHHGQTGEVYNVGSGELRSVQAVLDGLLAHSTVAVDVQIDPSLLRPNEPPGLRADISKIHAATGWQPAIPFEQTLADLLDDQRARVAAEKLETDRK